MNVAPDRTPGDRVLTVETAAGAEEIALLQHGEGPVWAVAWHGLAVVNRLSGWEYVVPPRTGRSLLCAGLPGHGPVRPKSAAEYAAWTPESFIGAGVGVLEAALAGPGSRVVLAGASLGGAMALGVACRVPEKVAGLILMCPLVWGESGGLVGFWAALADHPALARRVLDLTLGPARRSERLGLLTCRALVADQDGFSRNSVVSAAMSAGHSEWQTTDSRGLAGILPVIRAIDLRSEVERLPSGMPALVIHGTRDPIVSYEQACWLKAHLPGAELVPMPRTGHLPHAECQELVRRAIADWLRRLPEE